MTHTKESLMALVNDALNAAEKAEADRCSPMGSPSFRQSNADAREAEAALRLAIREVLAERDRYLDIIRREAWLEHASENDVESPYVPFTDWVAEKKRAEKAEAELAFKAALVHEMLPYQERAVKAEAEVERLRKWLDNNTTFCDDGRPVLASVSKRVWYHATDDVENYPFSSVIDAAMKEQP